MSFLLSNCKELDYSSLLAVNGGCDFSGASVGINGKSPITKINIPTNIPNIPAGVPYYPINTTPGGGGNSVSGYAVDCSGKYTLAHTTTGTDSCSVDGGYSGIHYDGVYTQTGVGIVLVKESNPKPVAAYIDPRKVY